MRGRVLRGLRLRRIGLGLIVLRLLHRRMLLGRAPALLEMRLRGRRLVCVILDTDLGETRILETGIGRRLIVTGEVGLEARIRLEVAEDRIRKSGVGVLRSGRS
ncbi:hypothetical protein AUC71_13015 [Methyloceanibacter marginalis]|uniref:Uncharacterized protein n=1 Tax=Methyloceanibacter marginalis TaxID=1774971 RepID=A0A1E3WBF3_9HYPH|nr:hypothetical protein [Methyloceanibacter marginalis]ODS02852.1 hypothetical protein AUC71_13015 [Methyloceanibacter marginalis]